MCSSFPQKMEIFRRNVSTEKISLESRDYFIKCDLVKSLVNAMNNSPVAALSNKDPLVVYSFYYTHSGRKNKTKTRNMFQSGKLKSMRVYYDF